MASASKTSPDPAVGEHRENIEVLDQASPNWIVDQLRGEPAPLYRCLETTHRWSWRDVVQSSRGGSTAFDRDDEPSSVVTEQVRRTLVKILSQNLVRDRDAMAFTTEQTSRSRFLDVSSASGKKRLRRWLPWPR